VLSLVVNPGLSEEQSYPLARGESTIGRTKDNDIFCVHKSLSRKHAKLEFDGRKIRVTDLASKNGIYFNGRRVDRCEVVEGDTFRCGDITFLVEGATARTANTSLPVQTLPSPFAASGASKRPGKAAPPPVIVEEDARDKEKLVVLIRASELLVAGLSLEKFLDEILVLAVQVLEVDRIGILTLDEETAALRPRVLKTFAGASPKPFSQRVVDWVIDNGSATTFGNVSKDLGLPGDAREDATIRGAMCAPINPGSGTIGVLYADSVSKVDCFRPDDLTFLRALANLVAVGIEGNAMRRVDRQSIIHG